MDVISYNALISACEKGGQYFHAMDMFNAMQATGVAPDVTTYSALNDALPGFGREERHHHHPVANKVPVERVVHIVC